MPNNKPDHLTLADDQRQYCQTRKNAYASAAWWANWLGKAIGFASLIAAVIAVVLEVSDHHIAGAVAACIAAVLALIDVFYRFPHQARDYAESFHRFRRAEALVAGIVAQMEHAPPGEKQRQLEQAVDLVTQAGAGTLPLSDFSLERARKKINAA